MGEQTGGRATIRDVAREAGVSATTVSHALNGKGVVREETRRRVEQIAADLGYRPSRTAQALRQGGAGAIALLLPDNGGAGESEPIGLDYHMRISSACARAAFGYGRSLMLPPRLASAADWRRVRPDGVVICDPTTHDEQIDLLDEVGVPVVSIDRDLGRPERTEFVAGDHDAGMSRLLDHLRAAGARRIGLLSPRTDWAWIAESRESYDRWCLAASYEPAIAELPLDRPARTPYVASGELLDAVESPDAIITMIDSWADGVVRACRERGLEIPGDVLVASGADGWILQQVDPPITAIDDYPEEHARTAVEMLVAWLGGEHPTEPRRIPSELRVRASTRR